MELVYKKTGILFKLLPCLLAVMVAFMTLYGSFVYASVDVPVSVSDKINETVTLGNWCDEYKTYFVYNLKDDGTGINYCVLISNQDLKFSLPTSSGGYITVFATDGSASIYVCGGDSYFYSNNESLSSVISRKYGDSYSLPDNPEFKTYFRLSYFGSNINNFDNFVFYGTGNVYDMDKNLLFQVPTQEVGIIAEQTQGVQMDKILQEILGILPVVLVVIVGLIAIRKGIAMIRTFLKKS